ncbi:hypothetical protein Daus18300_001376 [Diaporthe australafricana]|uniref:GPI inositol-deacylase n=1 Tax=Diaporthe australafricana TaxID=127596 RepID=A0ABR3XYQ3_9PEZI
MPEGVTSKENLSRERPRLSPLPASSSSGLSTFRRRISAASDTSSMPLQSDIGLHLIQAAGAEHPVADLILVHGLGGSWMKTWSWNHDVNIFWPAWLRSDDVLSRLRVFSFGYNANYLGSKNSSGILDFAKTLLFNMDGYSDDSGTIGQYPIIFVAHSMGGLVVKQAFILGLMNDTYAAMISQVFGIIFLSTPHKGSNFARVLNNILSVSVVSSSKTYVAELNSESPTLKHINEQFRLVVKDLQIVSFYETHTTRIAGSSVMAVDQDSGVLGYPTETSVPMEADHHQVSKFASPNDPKYTALTNALRPWVLRLTPKGYEAYPSEAVVSNEQRQPGSYQDKLKGLGEASHIISKILGIQEPPGLSTSQKMDGTCLWIQSQVDFKDWMQTNDNLGVLWLTGLPGTGKSVLAQSVIKSLKDPEHQAAHSCQYHLFSYADATRRKVGFALRSIAFQLAQDNHTFRDQLIQLYETTGIDFSEQEMQVLWSRIFEGTLFTTELDRPLYWVFDGLDEADNPVPLINLLLGARPRSPIRVFLTSRPASNLLILASAKRPVLKHLPLTDRESKDDVGLFIRRTVYDDIPIDDAGKEYIVQKMCKRASGSFLWAKLALITLTQNWHTQEDIERALNDVPEGMQSLFSRMLLTIGKMEHASPRNYSLVRRILTWAICSAEPLTTAELGSALESEFSKMQNLGATIVHLCGHFLTTVPSGNTGEVRIVPTHGTAKAFMLNAHDGRPAFLNESVCHEHIALVCIRYLSDDSWKSSLLNIDGSDSWSRSISSNRLSMFLSENPLFRYAVTHWAYHFSHSNEGSHELQAQLQDLFDNHILSWIHACAVLGKLRLITRSAQHIRVYGRRLGHRSASSSPKSLSHSVGEDASRLFKDWASDLIRVVGNFGKNILERPSCIYRLVARLCPKASMMYRTYSARSNMSLEGLLCFGTWDDCLARVPVGGERNISNVLCTVTYFVCLISTGGEIIVCLAETCEEIRRIRHGEYVRHMVANKSGSLLATAGVDTFRVWELSSGRELYRMPKAEFAMVSAIQFGAIDTELMVGYDDCEIVCYDMEAQAPRWTFVAEEDDGEYHPCPHVMEFSHDGTRLAMEFRGRPVQVWNLLSREVSPLSFMRAGEPLDLLDAIRWHPDSSSIFVMYQDASVVQYHLHDLQEVENRETRARCMAISQDGNLMLTSDYKGTLSLWTLPKIQLVYRIEYEEFARDLSFSPDARRFYDVRGPICNVWEPDVLLMPDQEDPEDLSDNDKSDTLFSGPVISKADTTKNHITALTCESSNQYYIIGKEDGSVTMYNIQDGKKIRRICAPDDDFSPVTTLVWSPTTKYLAMCGGGRVLTKRLEEKEHEPTPKWAVFPCLEFSVHMEVVRQFLFHPSERLMLVSFPTSEEVWDLKTKTQIWVRERSADLGLRWINHPTRKESLLCLERTETVVKKWPSLNVAPLGGPAPLPVSRPPQRAGSTPSPTASSHSTADRQEEATARTRTAAMGDNMNYVVSELLPDITSHTRTRRGELRLEIMATSRLAGVREGGTVRRELLAKISPSVRRLLGCFRDQIVFLNHEFWICTSPLSHASDSVRRHFFLPRDCIGESMLDCVTLAKGGLLLFPKNGEVAVIWNGLRL